MVSDRCAQVWHKEGIPASAKRAPESRTCWVTLNDDFQAELHVERFAWPDTGSTVPVTDGVRGDAKAAAVGGAGRRKVCAVEEVEHFHSKPGVSAFADFGVLKDLEVDRSTAWGVEGTAAACYPSSRRWIGKTAG